jgi:hypothetical protein
MHRLEGPAWSSLAGKLMQTAERLCVADGPGLPVSQWFSLVTDNGGIIWHRPTPCLTRVHTAFRYITNVANEPPVESHSMAAMQPARECTFTW